MTPVLLWLQRGGRTRDMPDPERVYDSLKGLGEDSPLARGALAVAIVLAVAAAIGFAWYWYHHYARPARLRREHRARLLARLFDAHRLLPEERRLVLALAEAQGLANPLLLFVRRPLWSEFRAARAGAEAERLAALERKLFE